MDPLDTRAARVAALDALARRDHASGELGRKLRDKGYDPGLVDGVIERLIAEKLVDDRRYVEAYIGFHAARGHGPQRVRADLQKLALRRELIDDGLAGYGDWMPQLHKTRQKKFGAQLPTHYPDKQRQARFLAYRGYTGAQIRMALGFDTDIDVES